METYCDYCNKFVELIIKPAPSRFGKVKGRYYEYDGKQVVCPNCGGILHIPEIDKFNLEQLQEKVEEQKCIVKNIVG